MLVLIGRSCVGKDTIQKILVEEYDMERVVTYTTRPPRDGEIDGIDYHFIGDKEYMYPDGEDWYVVDKSFVFFDNDLAEFSEYHVASGETWYYGSLKKDYEDSDNKVIILNPDGVKSIREQKIPAFIVEITTSDKDIKSRQISRGDEPEEAARRREADLVDFADISKYTDTCVINWGEGGPDRCARNICDLYKYWLSKRSESDVEN